MTSLMRILVIEDEPPLADLIAAGLRAEGLLLDAAERGEDALWMAATTPYDVVCLDVNLPGIDGFDTCRRMRETGVDIPILMLTARDAVDDRIAGLRIGADDYLVKPFDFGELVARLHALARRPPARAPERLVVGDLVMDLAARSLTRAGTPIELSAKELQIMEVFMRSPGRVLTRLQILEGAWDHGYEHRSNVIEVYVRYLREKIDRPFGRATLETVRGAGYRLRADS
ncbi:MAG TPA: response regulator transcription factor [Miltoncostaeaceae bacterium]|nr:response regulator transcription factor [Miltoncostaeaceae bacterium]